MRLASCILPALFLVYGCAGGFAQPLNLELQLVNRTEDGMPSRYLEIAGRNFKGKRYPAGHWTVATEAPDDASLRFYHRFQTELTMDFSVFSSAELLDDYSESELKQYVLNLKPLYARQGMQIEEARAAKAAVGSAPFMGASYWKIDYNLVAKDTGEMSRRVTEFVSVDEQGRNFRLRFSGPVALVRKFEHHFSAEVGRFTLD